MALGIEGKGYQSLGGSTPEGERMVGIFDHSGDEDGDAREEFERHMTIFADAFFAAAYEKAKRRGVVDESVPHVLIKVEDVWHTAQNVCSMLRG